MTIIDFNSARRRSAADLFAYVTAAEIGELIDILLASNSNGDLSERERLIDVLVEAGRDDVFEALACRTQGNPKPFDPDNSGVGTRLKVGGKTAYLSGGVFILDSARARVIASANMVGEAFPLVSISRPRAAEVWTVPYWVDAEAFLTLSLCGQRRLLKTILAGQETSGILPPSDFPHDGYRAYIALAAVLGDEEEGLRTIAERVQVAIKEDLGNKYALEILSCWRISPWLSKHELRTVVDLQSESSGPGPAHEAWQSAMLYERVNFQPFSCLSHPVGLGSGQTLNWAIRQAFHEMAYRSVDYNTWLRLAGMGRVNRGSVVLFPSAPFSLEFEEPDGTTTLLMVVTIPGEGGYEMEGLDSDGDPITIVQGPPIRQETGTAAIVAFASKGGLWWEGRDIVGMRSDGAVSPQFPSRQGEMLAEAVYGLLMAQAQGLLSVQSDEEGRQCVHLDMSSTACVP